MTQTIGLKPPPRFVHNQWAWAYTLNKMSAKGHVDEYGNPSNYGEAVAIYKRVANKYGAQIQQLPAAIEDPAEVVLQTRAVLLELQAPVWTVGHNAAWAANDVAHQRLYLQEHFRVARLHADIAVVEPMCFWRVERHEDDQVRDLAVDFDMALWLTEQSPVANEWVRARTEQLLVTLNEAVGEVDTADVTGRVRDVPVMAQFLDRRESKKRLQDAITDVTEVLADA